jgi:hypothetical protein
MEKSSVANRFLIPLFLGLVVMLSSRIVYLHASGIDSQSLSHTVAVISGTIQFLSIVLGALFIYPATYFKGARTAESVIAGSANLAVWLCIDTYHVGAAFTRLESLYYGINIGSILFAWNFALMGALVLACRTVSKRRGVPVRVITPLPFAPILVFVLVLYVLSKEGGAFYFNSLLDGYVALFKS